MSRIYLLRHAKAAIALPGMKDFDRPLDASGRDLASRLGATMLASGLAPARIIASPSARTRQTLALIAALLPSGIDTKFEQSLYNGVGDPYMAAIRSGGDGGSVMLVGHNPMTEEIALRLCETGAPDAMAKLHYGFPTGGLAILDVPGALASTEPHKAYLAQFITGGTL
jgi:phosphohistidine phosphatase